MFVTCSSKGLLGQHIAKLPATSHGLYFNFTFYLAKEMQTINPSSSEVVEHGVWPGRWLSALCPPNEAACVS